MKHTIYAFISPSIKPFNAEAGTYGISCSATSALSATIDITHGREWKKKTLNLTLSSSELNVGPFASDPSTCHTLMSLILLAALC
ncbi:hypothetical protein M378DRAFT_451652 [Amanita muscaria Koide BX008]|uniref:Uncharacterized protein n=1 Tax=Amanita muscaria (strain Koide BX008) TaxID=946122 RepID=A0A0C2SRN9_AMAMK|nr:hypothetical protein M378DRAFT_451652 [Amanita muscaria Koide BX008]